MSIIKYLKGNYWINIKWLNKNKKKTGKEMNEENKKMSKPLLLLSFNEM